MVRKRPPGMQHRSSAEIGRKSISDWVWSEDLQLRAVCGPCRFKLWLLQRGSSSVWNFLCGGDRLCCDALFCYGAPCVSC
ncbi:hypothetical protein AGOR_G00057400 [Albula goreensis]|uniref:Uncharacterized protein n=1 Tax=Albula goreensis TaxID=1534307 RepID=A0A8T3E0M9_9TELE|nr:hypothetical protein AGOR_G00057400 [Albula goreensis]